MTYNGWANWETWNTVLWARNDEDTYAEWLSASRIFQNDKTGLKNFLKENMPYWTNADMAGDDYNMVNWDEVVDACLEESE